MRRLTRRCSRRRRRFDCYLPSAKARDLSRARCARLPLEPSLCTVISSFYASLPSQLNAILVSRTYSRLSISRGPEAIIRDHAPRAIPIATLCAPEIVISTKRLPRKTAFSGSRLLPFRSLSPSKTRSRFRSNNFHKLRLARRACATRPVVPTATPHAHASAR
jgi:hypothetical protein